MGSKKYWLFLMKEDGKWAMQFGSYDRSDCIAERANERAHGVKVTDLWVTSLPCKANGHAPSQATVDTFIGVLNHG